MKVNKTTKFLLAVHIVYETDSFEDTILTAINLVKPYIAKGTKQCKEFCDTFIYYFNQVMKFGMLWEIQNSIYNGCTFFEAVYEWDII